MTSTHSIDELRRIVPDADLLGDGDTEGYAVDGLRPSAVVRPADAEGVAAVLQFATANGLAVTARGGGTMIHQGNRPTRLDLVLDLTRLNRIVEHRPQDLTVTVLAGVTLKDLQAALAEHGQMLALDPPCAESATVGGVLASNASGPRRLRYGTARDLLIGSRALLADGTPVRSGGKVVKNVAGYDLNKLWIGSFGTLAVIVEATFKVIPSPSGLGMVVASFRSAGEAHAVAMAIAGSRLQPLSLELVGPSAVARLAAGTPIPVAGNAWWLVAEVGGAEPVVDRTMRELTQIATAGGASGVTTPEPWQRERLSERIRDFGHSSDDRAGWIVRVTVMPSETAGVLAAIEDAFGGVLPPVVTRAGNGVINCFPHERDGVDVADVVGRLRGRVDGSVVVERTPAAVKTGLDVWGLDGPDVALMRRIKETYDPSGTLSPGRMV